MSEEVKSMNSNFSAEETEKLVKVLGTLQEVEVFLKLRDRMNARVHLALPRYSPITKEVSKAVKTLVELVDAPSVKSEPEEDEDGESEADGFAPRYY